MTALHTFSLQMPQLGRARTIRVLLPRNYDRHSDRRFPVIYLQDGQNLFDAKTAAFHPWKLPRVMARQPLYRQAILVGIDHGGVDRLHEYAPYRRGHHGGQGDAYLRFIIDTLKPHIDQRYRTWPQREATAIAGSSMGGLIAFYAALRYPQVFGKAGVLSPSLWFNPGVLDLVAKTGSPRAQVCVAGSKTEARSMDATLQKVYWAFKNAGFSDDQLRVVLRDRGGHTEAFWRREFVGMYEWLFPRTVLG